MSIRPDSPPGGWYRDPANPGLERYWDGQAWTQVVRHSPQTTLKLRTHPQNTSRKADPALDLPLAGWWRRLGAGIIDSIIAWVLAAIVLLTAAPDFLSRTAEQYLAYSQEVADALLIGEFATPTQALANNVSTLLLALGGITAVYCIAFLGTWGATLGHKAVGVKVVRAPLSPSMIPPHTDYTFTEEKPGWLRAVSKGLSWALFSTGGSIFMLIQAVNVFLPLWHRRKQSVTDIFASTLLVKVHGERAEQIDQAQPSED